MVKILNKRLKILLNNPVCSIFGLLLIMQLQLRAEKIFDAQEMRDLHSLPKGWFLNCQNKHGYRFEKKYCATNNVSILRFTALQDHYLSSGYMSSFQEVKANTKYKLEANLAQFAGDIYLGIIHSNGKREGVEARCWGNSPLLQEFINPEFLNSHPPGKTLKLQLNFTSFFDDSKIRVFIGLIRCKGMLELENVFLTVANECN